MAEQPRRIAIDGQGVKPSTPKPTPTFVTPKTGAGQKLSTPKPAPEPAAAQKNR